VAFDELSYNPLCTQKYDYFFQRRGKMLRNSKAKSYSIIVAWVAFLIFPVTVGAQEQTPHQLVDELKTMLSAIIAKSKVKGTRQTAEKAVEKLDLLEEAIAAQKGDYKEQLGGVKDREKRIVRLNEQLASSQAELAAAATALTAAEATNEELAGQVASAHASSRERQVELLQQLASTREELAAAARTLRGVEHDLIVAQGELASRQPLDEIERLIARAILDRESELGRPLTENERARIEEWGREMQAWREGAEARQEARQRRAEQDEREARELEDFELTIGRAAREGRLLFDGIFPWVDSPFYTGEACRQITARDRFDRELVREGEELPAPSGREGEIVRHTSDRAGARTVHVVISGCCTSVTRNDGTTRGGALGLGQHRQRTRTEVDCSYISTEYTQ
jgi:uncharacterized protein YoxC